MNLVHLTEKEVAARLQVTTRTLRKWRDEGRGIPCMGLGSDNQTLRYRLSDVEDYEQGRMKFVGIPPPARQAITRAAQAFDVILRWDMRDESRGMIESLRNDLRSLLSTPK